MSEPSKEALAVAVKWKNTGHPADQRYVHELALLIDKHMNPLSDEDASMAIRKLYYRNIDQVSEALAKMRDIIVIVEQTGRTVNGAK